MHVLFRYYETSPRKSRDERVRETLETMGVSIMIGGVTTFLGVVPLCLSVTKVFMTVFLAFFAMVCLGISHGLVLLPVLLSYIGPTTGLPHTRYHDDKTNDSLVRPLEEPEVSEEETQEITDPTEVSPETSYEPSEEVPESSEEIPESSRTSISEELPESNARSTSDESDEDNVSATQSDASTYAQSIVTC